MVQFYCFDLPIARCENRALRKQPLRASPRLVALPLCPAAPSIGSAPARLSQMPSFPPREDMSHDELCHLTLPGYVSILSVVLVAISER
jgi:hypothetical protein